MGSAGSCRPEANVQRNWSGWPHTIMSPFYPKRTFGSAPREFHESDVSVIKATREVAAIDDDRAAVRETAGTGREEPANACTGTSVVESMHGGQQLRRSKGADAHPNIFRSYRTDTSFFCAALSDTITTSSPVDTASKIFAANAFGTPTHPCVAKPQRTLLPWMATPSGVSRKV